MLHLVKGGDAKGHTIQSGSYEMFKGGRLGGEAGTLGSWCPRTLERGRGRAAGVLGSPRGDRDVLGLTPALPAATLRVHRHPANPKV